MKKFSMKNEARRRNQLKQNLRLSPRSQVDLSTVTKERIEWGVSRPFLELKLNSLFVLMLMKQYDVK